MAWTDSLTPEDEETLARIQFAHGVRAFELYASVALQIRVNGPMPAVMLDNTMESWGDDLWRCVAGYFELRSDGCMHLKGAMS